MSVFTYPSRPAPAPPLWPRPYPELPSNHPFRNPYIPSQYDRLHRTSSSSSLDSEYSIHTPLSSPPRPPTSRAYSSTQTKGDYRCSPPRECRPPTAWLATPLTPSRSPYLGASYTASRTTQSPSPIYRPTPSAFIPLPKDLSILDSRPRTNLLADLEFIAGKKLHFPFLHRRRGSQEDKAIKVKAEKEKKRVVSAKSEKSGSPARLTKERKMTEEEEYLYEVTGVRQMRTGSARGRGVREGNSI